MTGRGYARSSAGRMIQVPRATDVLSDITVLTNGYSWHVRDAVGLGTAGFKVPERGLHTTFDLVQSTVANQPTALSENGSSQFRHRKSVDANPTSNIKTAGAVVAGWTGPTYVGMWLRVPDASGDITSASNAFFWHHTTVAPNLRLAMAVATGTPDLLQPTFSQDGTASGTARCAIWGNADWTWVEFIFDPALTLGGSTKDDKLKWFFNLSQRTLTTPPTPDFTAISDSTATLGVCCRLSTGNANVDTTDWASCYYCNGIPSVGDRRRMAGYYPPRTITF